MRTYNYLVLDVETTTSNKGNPFDQTNKLCYVGLKDNILFDIEHTDTPYKEKLEEIQKEIDKIETLVGFNIKFDLHWLKRYGIDFSTKRIWDCQLVHFILSGQKDTYPSLNKVAKHYNLESKLDIVAEEYWKNDIDTTDIPADILKETHPNNFADVAAAKAKLLSTKGLAVWEDNATNIQWGLSDDKHSLKVTADFGIPTDPDQKPWAEKFKEEYAALADLSKVGNTGLYNSALDFTTWGDNSAQLDTDAAASGDPTTVDPKRLGADEYAGGSMAPDGNDGKMSMGWEEDSSEHLF